MTYKSASLLAILQSTLSPSQNKLVPQVPG